MTKPLFQLDLPKRKASCSSGQEPFTSGMEYFSLLQENETGNWIRQDFCHNCWDKMPKPRPNSFWKSRIKSDKAIPLDMKEKAEAAKEYLRESLRRGSLEDLEDAFVLSVYLLRIKKLITCSQEGECVLYEDPASGELFQVPKLDLSTLQVDKVQKRLSQLKVFKGK